jgi:hypothetical protein
MTSLGDQLHERMVDTALGRIRLQIALAHLAGLENPPLVSALVEQFLFEDSESGCSAT